MKPRPDTIDIHVGNMLHNHRKLQKLTQEDLGNALGVTFQQIQKYEKGTNRLSASRLYKASRILNITIENFFEGLEDNQNINKNKSATLDILKLDPTTMDMVRLYQKIESDAVKKEIRNFIKAMLK